MAKKITKTLKLQIPAGKATPAPPIGPTLGQAGINIGEFVKQFNDKTRELGGDTVSVQVNVFEDRTFNFVIKSSPAAALLLKAAGKEKGAGKTGTVEAGTVTKAQVREIAEKKLADLNATDIEAAMRMIEGSARSMGIRVK